MALGSTRAGSEMRPSPQSLRSSAKQGYPSGYRSVLGHKGKRDIFDSVDVRSIVGTANC
ncbi:hypothetical protein T440DRAFT_463082 [Plenodomus tracheiphilus IPT5]|uniref:Uncharacterized protein n=1 Tax=Plenodomus tracheiphilus IPT5 TaxID=1408161 RepID=A0A6A7BN55_9PLEO|nr:hypothetical protein T440DRAFT_463082 [Plenodomus tracheiphilus IPT5]